MRMVRSPSYLRLSARVARACGRIRGAGARRVPRRGTARTARVRACGGSGPGTRASASETAFPRIGWSSRAVRQEFARARGGHEPVQPPRFGGDDPAAERGEPVVSTALIVELRDGAAVGFLDETAVDQLRDRSVERSPADVGMFPAGREVFLDAVRVALALDEREQHQEMERLE